MSKEQINYLLVLATLLVVWPFFNTVYGPAKRICGGPLSRGTVSASAQRLPNPEGMGMQEMQEMQNVSQPPNITELLKNQNRGWQARPGSGGMPSTSSEVPQKDKNAKS